MDPTDRRLLNLLQQDAGRTNAALAEAAGLTPSTCLRRVRRLRQAGLIRRIVAVLDPARLGRRLKAIVTVELHSHGAQQMRAFLDLALREEAVVQAHAVTGASDVVLILQLRDMAEFDALCERLFRDQTNVLRFVTMMVIRTAREETAMRL